MQKLKRLFIQLHRISRLRVSALELEEWRPTNSLRETLVMFTEKFIQNQSVNLNHC